MPLGKGIPSNEERKEGGHPVKKTSFCRYWLLWRKTVADRQRHAADHNKHWWRAT